MIYCNMMKDAKQNIGLFLHFGAQSQQEGGADGQGHFQPLHTCT